MNVYILIENYPSDKVHGVFAKKSLAVNKRDKLREKDIKKHNCEGECCVRNIYWQKYKVRT